MIRYTLTVHLKYNIIMHILYSTYLINVLLNLLCGNITVDLMHGNHCICRGISQV